MQKYFQKLILTLVFSPIFIFSQNITVDDSRTAQNLVENVLFGSTNCATLSNFQVSGGDFGTGENSYAYFNSNGSVFPFAEGVVLSTGTANHTIGPNNTLSDDEGINWQTDADLEAVFSNTLNATVLEFDFIPQSPFFSFDYIFASEEYQEGNANTCQYSDVFAFLIKPAGGQYTNIAVVPNTTIPVSVTSVHPEIPNGCAAQNEAYFGSWNDNTAPINFNGQTAILTAQSTVIPNQQYHIKLIIADHTNYRYDSAVFILANSFNFGIDLGQDRLIATQNALCGNETLLLDAGTGNAFQWYKNGVPLAGETNQQLTITTILGNGIYSVEKNTGFGCIAQGEIEIEYDTIPVLNNAELTQCINTASQTTTFDLTEAYNDIINGDTSLTFVEFTDNGSVIANPQNYTNTSQGQIVVAKMQKPSGCFEFANIVLKVYQNPEIKSDESLYYCTDTFPATITLESGLLNGNPTDYSILWSTGETSNEIQINAIGDYTVSLTNINGCEVSRTITILPSNMAIVSEILLTEKEFYPRVNAVINVTGDGNYVFAVDIDPLNQDDISFYQQENTFENLLFGEHILYVKDTNGCQTLVYPFLVLDYPKFLTPNNDGKYDTWNIDNINSLTHFNAISNIMIFDRFGRIIATINPKGIGWNGMYNGQKAAPDDYWFVVEMLDFKGKKIIKKGHFSLE